MDDDEFKKHQVSHMKHDRLFKNVMLFLSAGGLVFAILSYFK